MQNAAMSVHGRVKFSKLISSTPPGWMCGWWPVMYRCIYLYWKTYIQYTWKLITNLTKFNRHLTLKLGQGHIIICDRLTCNYINSWIDILINYGPPTFAQIQELRFMVFNVTFNNISVILLWSVLLVEETGVAWENHWPAASHWQTLSHNVVSSTPCHEWDLNSQL